RVHDMTATDPMRAGALLTIDLDAIVANYRALGARLSPARPAAVVKADAYGLGAGPVAEALARAGCTDFFVAHLDEGIELRAAIRPPLGIFERIRTPPGTEPGVAAHDLIPVETSIDPPE